MELRNDAPLCARCGLTIDSSAGPTDIRTDSSTERSHSPAPAAPRIAVRTKLWLLAVSVLLLVSALWIFHSRGQNSTSLSGPATNQTDDANSSATATIRSSIPSSKAIPSGAQNKNAALISAARDGDLAGIHKGLTAGTDVNGGGRTDEFTPIMWAALNGHTEIVKVLLANRADVNAKTSNGHTALMCVTKGTSIGTMLLAAGADVNASRDDGLTPLIQAVLTGNREMVTALLAKEADVNARIAPDHGMFARWSALDFANWKGEAGIARLLQSRKDAHPH
jgi:hypothetical protein